MSISFTVPQQSTPASSSVREEQRFTISSPIPSTFILSQTPAIDVDGDAILDVILNGWRAQRGVDYSLTGSTITWTSSVVLEVGEQLICLYLPDVP